MNEWLDELRLEPGPPYGAMGTHLLDVDSWLVVDDQRQHDLDLKAKLLDNERDIVFGSLPGSEAAADELLGLIRQWLAQQGHAVSAPHGDDHPLVEAARLVQEDLAIMQRIDRQWILTAGCVCFPTHWTVTRKIGLPLAGIHQPVAHYANELRDRIDRFHDRLTAERPVWRRNWFVLPTSELHLPERDEDHYRDYQVAAIEVDGSPLWIRSERQTLRRLAGTDAIAFTIRVQQLPLGVLLERRDLAARMLAATRSWDGPKRAYTSTGGVLDELIEWLDHVAGGTSPAPN